MKRSSIAVLILLVFIAGCSSTKVTRIDPQKPIDLSGDWNDYDTTLVSQEMIDDCLGGQWLKDFSEAKGRSPVVIVGYISNRSYEHVNTQLFTKDLERILLNSGKVKFVASPQEREQVRTERQDQQQGNTDPETIKQIGKEKGADFMLAGSVNSIKDETKGRSVNFFQVNLELIDLTTNEKVWIGQKDIKKLVEQRKISF